MDSEQIGCMRALIICKGERRMSVDQLCLEFLERMGYEMPMVLLHLREEFRLYTLEKTVFVAVVPHLADEHMRLLIMDTPDDDSGAESLWSAIVMRGAVPRRDLAAAGCLCARTDKQKLSSSSALRSCVF